MWTFNAKFEKVLEKSNETYWIFEKVNLTPRRTKDGTFKYSETLSNYIEERIPTTVNWQGYTPNVIFMQEYREAEESHFVQNVITKKAINDRYITTNNYDNKQEFNDAI